MEERLRQGILASGRGVGKYLEKGTRHLTALRSLGDVCKLTHVACVLQERMCVSVELGAERGNLGEEREARPVLEVCGL